MAEIETNNNGQAKKSKRNTRVDLTPMVDLGFLLITFFIFTTALSKPVGLKFYLPKNNVSTPPPEIQNSKVLTILPAGENKIYYYYGTELNTIYQTNFGKEGIRKIIMHKKMEVAKKFGDAQQTFIMIKPTDQSSYQNVIDIFDEMLINEIHRYMLLEPNEIELKKIM